MKTIKVFFLISFLFMTSLFSQNKASITVVKNYKNWNWKEVYVAKNPYISVAVVPQAAGRILEYNLGEVPSLWINPKLMGKSFAPTDEVKMQEWRNFGGYRLVPLPIENCSVDKDGNTAKRWPPPAIIGDSPYKVEKGMDKKGNETIEVTSGIQDLPVPSYNGKLKRFVYPNKIEEKLEYSRSLYIEPNSSLVHINHHLKNVGDKEMKRGIMISSQHVSRSKPELTDGENFVAYIPFSKEYLLPNGKQYQVMSSPEARWKYINKNRFKLNKNNPEDVAKYYNHGTNWKGEVAPGIYEVEYDYNLMAGFHIVSSESWICYVNKTNNTAFAKMMEPYDTSLAYDHGLNMAIFCSGLETGYLETEVKTPLYNLKPSESFDYKEIHGAAKIQNTPVLAVTMAGITTQKLNCENGQVLGSYGIFVASSAYLVAENEKGVEIDRIFIEKVNPLQPLNVHVHYTKLFNKLKIVLVDGDNKEYELDKFNK
ncbi:hypothetical protein FHR24_001805 [Wenyingzhuangia heitensis]|uniref:Uncharacterized protein n=1 Tax=Wenyingzhuangia heitensis TaxID=1487859 RepID=A0ABX0U914_9FLAO|nr:hypothetical protein [Wenyingzhuangia heitensis]NIJ45337.1 hypothetical protein [Wenyingzhuangia heitensis]